MANTVIALKKSGTAAATPSSLANGELAINYADGKLFYKNTTGDIVSITSGSSSNAFATVNASGTLILADSPSSILTIVSGSGIGIVGDAVNDKITISSIGSNVAIAAFDKANAANIAAGSAYDTANAAGGSSSVAAFDRANSAQTIAIAAFTTANSAGGSAAGTAFDRANAAQTIAIAAFTTANTNYINLANIVIFSNTTVSTNANSGAVIIAGGLGVSGNVYIANRLGYSNTSNQTVVYTYYNATTLSLDTVFG
jgi:hypothetical protein